MSDLEVVNDAKNKAIIRAEIAEKRIEELEAKIERMKSPQNCKHSLILVRCDKSISIDCEKEKYLHEDNWQEMCKGCEYWESRR